MFFYPFLSHNCVPKKTIKALESNVGIKRNGAYSRSGLLVAMYVTQPVKIAHDKNIPKCLKFTTLFLVFKVMNGFF